MAILKSPLFSDYHTFVPSKPVSRGIQWGLDARRATIFFRRASVIKNSLEKGETPPIKIFGDFSPNTSDHSIITPYHKELESKKDNLRFGEAADNSLSHVGIPAERGASLEDYVAIVDLDAQGPDQGYEVIRLPFIPKELNYNSESSFVAIKPLGANNPRYQFTGSEDKLEFEIDWHSFDEDRRDVITKCRKIESLAKADGYTGNPHRVVLQWGNSNLLFSAHEFIVISAPYRLTQFSKGHYSSDGSLKLTHMLPVQAYQTVTLARITSNNLSKIDIEFVADETNARKL